MSKYNDITKARMKKMFEGAAANEILRAELLKVAGWLDRLASMSDTQSKNNRDFPAFSDACERDAQNYRKTREHIMAAIKKADGCK